MTFTWRPSRGEDFEIGILKFAGLSSLEDESPHNFQFVVAKTCLPFRQRNFVEIKLTAMIARPAVSFKAFYAHQPKDDDGNKNTKAFTDTLDDEDVERRIRNFTEEINAVFFAADAEGKIQILHSPKNFGGTRLRPKHKVAALVSLGTRATTVQLDEKHAVSVTSLRCPNLNLVDAQSTAEGIKSIPIPDDNAVITCDATNIFLPAPWLRNAVFEEDSTCPFEIIVSVR